ncbi:hypothetical protein [Streptomyces sp. SP18ES09]|uniref:hypothetical protein n=1 Tax=Streptomyces sp. SP18ES09 TaxID=3002532 RepID=UPI003FCE9FB3
MPLAERADLRHRERVFSLAGYTPEAHTRAAEIGLPLFVLDLTGTPQPVNDAAQALTTGGA